MSNEIKTLREIILNSVISDLEKQPFEKLFENFDYEGVATVDNEFDIEYKADGFSAVASDDDGNFELNFDKLEFSFTIIDTIKY